MELLGEVLKGTAPRRRGWLERIERGRAEGRFEELHRRDRRRCSAGRPGLRVHVIEPPRHDLGWLDVTGVVCRTGFNKSALTLPLLRRLVEHYGIPVEDGRHQAASRNCGVPGLDRPDSRLCMMGITPTT